MLKLITRFLVKVDEKTKKNSLMSLNKISGSDIIQFWV
jgi:hypothetical protein